LLHSKIDSSAVLQKGKVLTASKEQGNKNDGNNGGVLPSIMNMIRSPVSLSVQGNPEQDTNAPGSSFGAGPAASHCAMFPFTTKSHTYEILCGLSHFRGKHSVFFKTELYAEVNTILI
jgi:hypothetical protein